MSQSPRSRVRSGNTDPLNDKIVSSGVDTAVFHLKIEPDAGLIKWLSDLQQMAREYEDASSIETDLSFHDSPLYLLAWARRAWSLVLRNDWLDVQIGRGGVSGVYVVLRLSSVYLHSVDFYDAVPALQRWCFEVFGQDAVLFVSELHLYRDVMLDLDQFALDGSLERGLVRRARKASRIMNGRRLETLMLGRRGGAIHAVLYDKTAEIKQSGKTYFHDIWKRSGWDGESRVWRLEVRFSREFLRLAGIDGAYDALDRLADLWQYSTSQWLRHVVTHEGMSDRDRERAPVSSWWAVYAAGFDFGAGIGYLARERKRQFKTEKLLRQAHGCMRSFFALLDASEQFDRDLVHRITTAQLIDKLVDQSGEDWSTIIVRRRARLAAA